MTITEIREICLAFPAVTEDIKWDDHLCFNIGGKMFLVTAPDNVPVSASFKTSDDDFSALPNRTGFIPAPYMAKNKWIFVDDINRFSKKEWEKYLQSAYKLIASKLSLKLQKEIAGGKPTSTPTTKSTGKRVAKKPSAIKRPAGRRKKAVARKKTVAKKKK